MIEFQPMPDLACDLCPQPLSHIASLYKSFFVLMAFFNLMVE